MRHWRGSKSAERKNDQNPEGQRRLFNAVTTALPLNCCPNLSTLHVLASRHHLTKLHVEGFSRIAGLDGQRRLVLAAEKNLHLRTTDRQEGFSSSIFVTVGDRRGGTLCAAVHSW